MKAASVLTVNENDQAEASCSMFLLDTHHVRGNMKDHQPAKRQSRCGKNSRHEIKPFLFYVHLLCSRVKPLGVPASSLALVDPNSFSEICFSGIFMSFEYRIT